MSILDSIKAHIEDEEKALIIFKDNLDYALQHNLAFDIELYSNQIELTNKRIGKAELELHRLKGA